MAAKSWRPFVVMRPSTISTLRMLDVSIWMLYSSGTEAMAAKNELASNRR